MSIIDDLVNRCKDYRVISIIGMGKNVGKTTTLNHLIKKFKGNYTLGLTSIGRDGEKYDVITQLPKPRIFIEEGSYIATAEQCYQESDIEMKVIKPTGFGTPLGEIMIYKALNSGYIELAGPSINMHLLKICNEFRDLDCNLVLVDGAFDRRSYATPSISDATILATGAALSENLSDVVNMTTHVVKLLTLENEGDKEILALARQILDESKIGMINSKKSVKILNVLTALGSAKIIIENLEEDTKHVVINGAITDQLIETLMKTTKKYKGVAFLVEDSTKLFLSRKTLNTFQKKGGILNVINPIKIIAITINPASPFGHKFDSDEFINLLKERISMPIYDLGPND